MEKTQNLTDEQVVKLVLEDQDYFLVVINRYKTKLFTFIKRLTNICDEDAEDVLQEVFLKIYLSLNGFDNGLKFSSWAYAITRNQVISNHRKLKARAEGYAVGLDDEAASRLASKIDVEKDMDSLLDKQKISLILNRLDEKYREVLVLKFIEEKDYKEISDIIRKPSGTVGSMINKAKELFRKEAEKQNIKISL
ncbi:RNA polymerase sigma factor [Candidatus Falkowbacteria bacterium]|nr:RNA polymerase sigma factor [Candidatus Falkowbacteria bacterium]